MQLYKKSIFLSVFFVVLFFSSCEIINPEETIPSYLSIDTIRLEVTSGSNSSKITDAWVYVDDQPIGAFELPAKFPVLVDGKHKLFIKAGIKVSGIAETRGAYPFYEGYTTEINFIKDSIIKVNPIVHYFSTTQFHIDEDFESSGELFEKTTNSDTTLDKTNNINDVFDGNYSGIVHLTTAKNFFECKSIESFKFPTGGKPIYVEIDYKNDFPFNVGFIANYSQSAQQLSVLTLKKSDNWNKIYVNLTDAVSYYSDANNFNIFIKASLPDSISEGSLHFDNIRLVYN
jgi:hypothetical protein